MEIQIMKIYDIVEGKWLRDNESEEKREKDINGYEDFGISTRLITYDEEKEWINREKDYLERRKVQDDSFRV